MQQIQARALSCKLSLEMVQGSDGKREDEVASSQGWWFYTALRSGGDGDTRGFPYLSFPLHSLPGDFPLFFSLSLQIFFLFIQISLSNFFDRSSSVSHFCRRNQQRITFHSPAIQVILLLCGDVIFPSRAMAGSQNTHKIIHSAPELGHNLAPASAAPIIHSSVPQVASRTPQ